MSEATDHHCPGCGVALKSFPRYPWHFCNDCCRSAVGHDGRPLVFHNQTATGGFVWGFADEDERYVGGSLVCLIKQRPVVVREARFGGVVAEPYYRASGSVVDVRKAGFDRSTFTRFTESGRVGRP